MAILQTLIEQKKRMARFTGELYSIKKPAAIGYPIALEIGYRKKVRETALYLTSLVEKHLLPNLTGLIQEAKSERFDAYIDTLDRIIETIQKEYDDQYSEDTIRFIASDQANKVSNYHRNRLTRILSNSIGIDVFLTEPYLATALNLFIKENVSLIKSISTDHLRELQQTINQGIRSGKTTQETEKEIKNRWGDFLINKPKNRAELIARDQNGKLFGQLNHLRQTELGIKKYEWKTVMDDRVRDNHRNKESNIYYWNKPPSDTGHPGEDYQCRCWAQPLLTGLV